jgi:hypothetical protein
MWRLAKKLLTHAQTTAVRRRSRTRRDFFAPYSALFYEYEPLYSIFTTLADRKAADGGGTGAPSSD